MNPVVIVGPPGAGKSHLLSAIYFELRKQPDVEIRGTSADRLVELVGDARAEIARYDVLLIDDLRNAATFAYLAETLTAFARHGGQVVITTRSDTDALDELREWVKEFEWGYVAQCEPLDRPTPGQTRGSRAPFDLNHDVLRDVGLGALTVRQADHVLETAYQRLERKIGERVMNTGRQRLERLGVIDQTKTDELSYDELRSAVPLLHLIVWEEIIALRRKLATQAPAIQLIESTLADSGLAAAYVNCMKGSPPFVTE